MIKVLGPSYKKEIRLGQCLHTVCIRGAVLGLRYDVGGIRTAAGEDGIEWSPCVNSTEVIARCSCRRGTMNAVSFCGYSLNKRFVWNAIFGSLSLKTRRPEVLAQRTDRLVAAAI